MFSNQGLSNYAAAKAGVYGLMKAMAYEGMSFGVQVNCILPYAATRAPGVVRVPGIEDERRKYISDEEVAKVPPERYDPRLIAHLVAYLVHRGCEISGEAFSVCQGRYARVYVGVAHGWLAPDPQEVDAEAVKEHIADIRDVTHGHVPNWLYDESAAVTRRLLA
jgi:NAD(P)-dependent dehydrogenase (short-subunit alcohol dehydrogenase family)